MYEQRDRAGYRYAEEMCEQERFMCFDGLIYWMIMQWNSNVNYLFTFLGKLPGILKYGLGDSREIVIKFSKNGKRRLKSLAEKR